jgi:hypothetical protein
MFILNSHLFVPGTDPKNRAMEEAGRQILSPHGALSVTGRENHEITVIQPICLLQL